MIERDYVMSAPWGWRMWKVTTSGNLGALVTLGGMTHPYWPQREAAKATCKAQNGVTTCPNCGYCIHEVPVLTCTCGWHIFNTLTDCLSQIDKNYYGMAVGTCYYWGKTVVHRYGVRSQYAYPKDIFIASEHLVPKIEAAYGCNVGLFTDLSKITVPMFGETFDGLANKLRENYR